MAKARAERPLFIYDTYGDWQATRFGDNIFDTRGEWVGFVDGDEVWTAGGEWIGKLSRDGRILRKRAARHRPLRRDLPSRPPKPEKLPAHAPLPSMMAELSYDTIDVLEEEPDIFKRVSDLRQDMD
jgi:hypothetical protein